MNELKIKLVDLNEKMVEAWSKDFGNEPNVIIELADLTKVDCDAVVSPANSFGFMDGGIDLYLSERFGWDLQDRLQAQIQSSEEGELLVGKSLVVPTNDPKVPYLVSSPTMRVPMNFNIHTSVNAYLAMKSTLITCLKDDRISTVAIPGMCTGCGKMSFRVAAKQMFMAYKEIVLNEKQNYATFGEAQKYQMSLNDQSLIWRIK